MSTSSFEALMLSTPVPASDEQKLFCAFWRAHRNAIWETLTVMHQNAIDDYKSEPHYYEEAEAAWAFFTEFPYEMTRCEPIAGWRGQ